MISCKNKNKCLKILQINLLSTLDGVTYHLILKCTPFVCWEWFGCQVEHPVDVWILSSYEVQMKIQKYIVTKGRIISRDFVAFFFFFFFLLDLEIFWAVIKILAVLFQNLSWLFFISIISSPLKAIKQKQSLLQSSCLLLQSYNAPHQLT